MIAGGGGGQDNRKAAGSGGGITGGDFDNKEYSGANQTHHGKYLDYPPGTFGIGFIGEDNMIHNYFPGGGGGLYGGGLGAGGSGFVYSEDRLTTEIDPLPASIRVENSELKFANNRGHGYAIITSLSPSECKCVQKCFCSNERLLLRNVHAVPFMYSYLFKS